MKKMKLFMDTHDKEKGTFPDNLSKAQFAEFYAKYNEICNEEGVINLRVHVGMEDGKAFCFNMATSIEPIRRAHERAGLPYDSITEISTASPGDMFFNAA